MRNFKRYLSFVAVFAMLFTSCSKEEAGVESGKATLSFGAIVNDLVTNRSQTKDHLSDFPECSDDTPSYVEIVLMEGDTEIVGTSENPFRISLVSGKLFTAEVPELELEEGNYTLAHFAVYNNDEELVWLAPRAGSSLGEYVNNTLPLNIDLRSGVKKYVEVSVLCFDNRNVNEYGYLFFELDTNVAIEYCFFANFCNEDGRHFPASYRVSIWAGTSSSGTPLYTNVVNNTGQHENGDYFATPLCFALPDNADMNQKYLYYEVTLLDWTEVYGDVDPMMKSGTLSKQDIMNNFDGDDNAEYQHIRFGCDNDDPDGPDDADNDGVVDSEDQCPNEAGPASNNGCPVTEPVDTDNDGIVDPEDQCPNEAGPASNNGCPVTEPVDTDNDGIVDSEDQCPNEAGPASNNGCPVTEPVDTDNDGIVDSEDQCPNEAGPASNNGCPVTEPVDTDNDGIVDSEDQCPNEAGPASNNGCPEQCVIDSPDAGCNQVFLEGNNAFSQITDPGQSPGFFALLDAQGESVGSVTITLNENNNPVVVVNMGFGFDVNDYRIEVSQVASGTNSVCVVENNYTAPTGEDPDIFEILDPTPDYIYPFYVQITANVCAE